MMLQPGRYFPLESHGLNPKSAKNTGLSAMRYGLGLLKTDPQQSYKHIIPFSFDWPISGMLSLWLNIQQGELLI